MGKLKKVEVPFFVKRLFYIFSRHRTTLVTSLISRLCVKTEIFFSSLLYSLFFNKKELTDILNQPYKFIDYSCGKIQWNGALLQRYRQISDTFSISGGLVFAGSLPHVDKIRFLRRESKTLIVINPFIKPLIKDIENLLKSQSKPVLVRVQSTDFSISYEQMLEWQQLGFTVLYEYIDPFHEEISGPISPKIIERHNKVLENEDIFICASAKALLNEIPRSRKNYFLSPNAASPEHWNVQLKKWDANPLIDTITKIRLLNKPILGYHGALAKWIDYELLKKIAQQNRFTLLLIGIEYDNSLPESKLLEFKNVCYVGPVNYAVLPSIARFYDVSLIPFKNSALSDGVSPIKLFEYMAIGKPIVVTSNNELKQYKSCILAVDHKDFLKKIELALALSEDKNYLATLRLESKLNSWKNRCDAILSHCGIENSHE